MIIKIPYGSKPGEKIISEGFWACPVCKCKRPNIKKKIVKVNYFGLINISSNKALVEFVQCGGCLNVFPIEIAEPQNQLTITLLDQPLPPSSLFDEWQDSYQNLDCDNLILSDSKITPINSPLLKTSASEMQKAGLAIKLKMFEEARIHLYNIFILFDKWVESDTALNKTLSAKYKNEYLKTRQLYLVKHQQFLDIAHNLLSKLP